jgi:mannitol/fructose-specific phosphotransferase system IIA component (Ntr-type)
LDISSYLPIESCGKDFTASSKEGAIRGMAKLLAASPNVGSDLEDDIAEGLSAREKLGSTGFGDGIAVPHCKVEGMDGFAMALAISPKGVPFKAMDGRSVHIICAIAGPESDPDTHLRLLAAAARILSISRVRYEILRSASRYALREAFLYHASISAACKIDAEACRKLMVVVLQEEKSYREVMELFLELDIPGAVTHEGSLMGETLSTVPLFAGFMDVLGSSKPETRTVMALVPESSIDDIVGAIEEITGDLSTHKGACVMVLTPDLIRGSLETI